MNYPVWELTGVGGAQLVALIAVLHVYISHLAVGGGIFIWLTDLKGFREGNPEIHAYVKQHTWFFLLLTMVFGGMTGVGIWFVIALVSPAATSALIHAFVFGWAIEWVFFLGEILSLLVYHYCFDRLDRKTRLNLAFLYALFAWLSLVVINGILCFMLTPGRWLETQNFWDGFFNPTYFPSLFFRTFAALTFAGLFGYVTTVFLKDGDFRTRMMRYCTGWLLLPAIGLIPSAVWYWASVPAETREVTFGMNPATMGYVYVLLAASVLIFVIGLLQARKWPLAVQRAFTFVLIPIGLAWMGGFEYTREIARKPYLIHGFMYSTSIRASEVDALNKTGALPAAKWTAIHEVTRDNRAEAGRELFNLQCLSCHTVGGARDILSRTETLTPLGLVSVLTGQGKMSPYMPEFAGTAAEKWALATYIFEGLHGKTVALPEAYEAVDREPEIPAFDTEKAAYVLLAWSELGMHNLSDSDPWFVLMPPGNTLEAQLIKRGPKPQLVTEGVTLSYRVEAGFENPSAHVPFWDYSASTFGKTFDKNVGLSGLGLSGEFAPDGERQGFVARHIPVVPYSDDGTFNPYPLFTVEARDAESGNLLGSTQVVAPVSTEMGCRNCHGGGWRWKGIAGVADETAENILKIHDQRSGTDLLAQARAGQPRLCQSCHADPALGAAGDPARRNLSAAMHGFHANTMPYSDERACALCHPANPEGKTQCLRGMHKILEVTCVGCHGTMPDHALSLLVEQAEVAGTARTMANLKPVSVERVEDIRPRTPWLNEPDCTSCHVRFEEPDADATGFNRWVSSPDRLFRARTDNAGVRCPACHGATHAVYPTDSPFGANRDHIQPLQYTGLPLPIGSDMKCEVCHTKKMDVSLHHRNTVRMFRNRFVLEE